MQGISRLAGEQLPSQLDSALQC